MCSGGLAVEIRFMVASFTHKQQASTPASWQAERREVGEYLASIEPTYRSV